MAKLPDDTESLALLSRKLALTPQIEASVEHQLRQSGKLVDLPGSKEPLVSKGDLLETLEQFLGEVPAAANTIALNKQLRGGK